MIKDYSKAQIITLKNLNEVYTPVDDDDAVMNAAKGDVVINYFQTNLTEVLKAGDSLKVMAITSEAIAYYNQLASAELEVTMEDM